MYLTPAFLAFSGQNKFGSLFFNIRVPVLEKIFKVFSDYTSCYKWAIAFSWLGIISLMDLMFSWRR